jgi:hypothetical protein
LSTGTIGTGAPTRKSTVWTSCGSIYKKKRAPGGMNSSLSSEQLNNKNGWIIKVNPSVFAQSPALSR